MDAGGWAGLVPTESADARSMAQATGGKLARTGAGTAPTDEQDAVRWTGAALLAAGLAGGYQLYGFMNRCIEEQAGARGVSRELELAFPSTANALVALRSLHRVCEPRQRDAVLLTQYVTASFEWLFRFALPVLQLKAADRPESEVPQPVEVTQCVMRTAQALDDLCALTPYDGGLVQLYTLRVRLPNAHSVRRYYEELYWFLGGVLSEYGAGWRYYHKLRHREANRASQAALRKGVEEFLSGDRGMRERVRGWAASRIADKQWLYKKFSDGLLGKDTILDEYRSAPYQIPLFNAVVERSFVPAGRPVQ